MGFFRGDASEIFQLADDLAQVTPKTVAALRSGMGEAGNALARDWASNARETSGSHGVHYPASIDAELVLDFSGVSVDVGPNAGKRQGGMGKGFEFGSRNQPPHLDGLRALDGIQKRVERIVDSAVTFP